jgi:POT family proton-dependent oligopeptide transporter
MEVKKGHPKALYLLSLAEMWERFSYYGMRALLIFYMTRRFQFADRDAYAVYGSYTALVYATPVFGGLLADRLLGFRKAVVLGGTLMALGHFAMAVERLSVFYLALGLLICGNGFFKPNISTIVGRLYPPDDPRRDGGFTIFYMGINLGAGAAPLVCGYLGETLGWRYGFGLAGIGMVVGLSVFLSIQKLLAGAAEPPDPEKLQRRVIPGVSRETAVYVGAALAVLLAWQLVQRDSIVGSLLSAVGAIVALALIYYLIAKCDRGERDRLIVALTLTLFAVVFWAFFEQAGSSINLFTERNVDRSIFGKTIVPSVFQSVNPAFILLLAPLFSGAWVRLARLDREPSTPVKFALGLLQLGLGFAALYAGAVSSQKDGMVPLAWLVLGYFLHTTGELCLSPVGLSMITKLSPQRIVGLMMGTWFLSTAFAQYAAGLIAMLTGVHEGSGNAKHALLPTQTLMVYGSVFGKLAVVAIIVSIVLFTLAPWLTRRIHEVH